MKTIEQQIATIAAWPRPAGVYWSIHFRFSTRDIVIAMVAGELAETHFIKGEPDDREEFLAVQKAEALLARWTRMQEARQADDATERFPAWILRATAAIREIEKNAAVSLEEVSSFAVLLLLSAECEDIPAPDLRLTNDHCIRLAWKAPGRGACIEVRPRATVAILRWDETQAFPPVIHKRDHFQAIRDVIGWLFPAANATHATPDL